MLTRRRHNRDDAILIDRQPSRTVAAVRTCPHANIAEGTLMAGLEFDHRGLIPV